MFASCCAHRSRCSRFTFHRCSLLCSALCTVMWIPPFAFVTLRSLRHARISHSYITCHYRCSSFAIRHNSTYHHIRASSELLHVGIHTPFDISRSRHPHPAYSSLSFNTSRHDPTHQTTPHHRITPQRAPTHSLFNDVALHVISPLVFIRTSLFVIRCRLRHSPFAFDVWWRNARVVR